MMNKLILMGLCLAGLVSCSKPTPSELGQSNKIPVIFDTDANNELDDQHALAYLLCSGDAFNLVGITVNATWGGGDVVEHHREAERILSLFNLKGKIPLLKGANQNFPEIQPQVMEDDFDGAEAVHFLLQATAKAREKLVVIAVGKLTNVALALKKDPSFGKKIRLVWLGSNFPEAGEYNLENDTASLNFILHAEIPLEMVTVRYGTKGGSDEVRVTQEEINIKMPGRGPLAQSPVRGRHGAAFSHFGDYSVDLFKHIDYHGNPPSRALYDLVAVAMVKNPAWGKQVLLPGHHYKQGHWEKQNDQGKTLTLWENFQGDSILNDFYRVLEVPMLVEEPSGF